MAPWCVSPPSCVIPMIHKHRVATKSNSHNGDATAVCSLALAALLLCYHEMGWGLAENKNKNSFWFGQLGTTRGTCSTVTGMQNLYFLRKHTPTTFFPMSHFLLSACLCISRCLPCLICALFPWGMQCNACVVFRFFFIATIN